MWEIMQPSLDAHFEEHFGAMRARHVELEEFIEKYREPLTLFVNATDLETAMASIQKGRDPPTAVMLRILDGGRTTKNIFSAQAAKMDFNLFVQNAVQRVKDLENLNFAEEEVTAFEGIMVGEARRLFDSGHVSFERKDVEMNFLGVELKLPVSDPHELWKNVLMARVKTIAVQNGLVPALPWETALAASQGGWKSLSTTVDIAGSVLSDIKIARRAALKMLGDAPLNFADARGVFHSQSKALLELDGTFRLELTYLNDVVEEKASDILRDQVLHALPAESRLVTMKQARVSYDT